MKVQQIKMGNTAINAVFAQSFDTEDEFITALENEAFPGKDIQTRRKLLKEAYKIAKRMKSKTQPSQPEPVSAGKGNATPKTAKTTRKRLNPKI